MALERSQEKAGSRRRLRIRLYVLGSALLTLGLCRLLAASPSSVEYGYSSGAGVYIPRMLSLGTGWLPFSLAEAIVAAFVLIALGLFVWAARVLLLHRSEAVGRLLSVFGLGCVAVVVVITSFYPLWGLNYTRPPLPDRLGWHRDTIRDREVSPAELEAQCGRLAEAVNRNYEDATGSSDARLVTKLNGTSAGLDSAIERACAVAQQRLGLSPSFAMRCGRAKGLLLSPLLSYAGLGGFYFPWTGEANYNTALPACRVPFTVAHEKAHQRGIAREDEANFIACMVCGCSNDPYVRYSGYLQAYCELYNMLADVNPERAAALATLLCPGARRDLAAVAAFLDAHESCLWPMGASLNDAYLQLQGVEEGVSSYRMSSSLLVSFARVNGGTCVIDLEDGPQAP